MVRSSINIDSKEFQKSINNELDVVKDRVRNLIGDAHWGEEGRYKEAVLRNVIRRFLPLNTSIGTGFIVKNSNSISSQIDIIIYDTTIPVLFSEGDFIITTPENTKGIIEVKTRIKNYDLNNILKESTDNGKKIGKKIFNGIFSYEYNGDIHAGVFENCLKESKGYVNHLSLGKDIFIKYWKKGVNFSVPVNCDCDFYNVYNLPDLSFSYFISNLLTSVCNKKLDDRFWFLFPIAGTKETSRVRTICLD